MTVMATPQRRTTDTARQRAPNVSRPCRVLHVIPSLGCGGMERAFLRLIRGFAENRTCRQDSESLVHGVCVVAEQDERLLAECRSLASTWVLNDPPARARLGRRCVWRQLRALIDVFRPDVVHARSTGLWFDAAAATWGRPHTKLLLSFHGRTSLAPPSWRRRMINRCASRRADAVLAVSHEAARMMHDEWKLPLYKLCTIPNGIDTWRYRPVEDAESVCVLRDELDIRRGEQVVICVANLVEIKAVDVLLNAWRHVVMVNPSARLLLAGDGPLRGELDRLASFLRCAESVRFLGHRRDVPDLLRAADLFVLPSRYEACSNAVLEAMASALPVVACDVGGMREVIDPGRTGWLVPPGQPDQLAEAITAALLDAPSRRRMGYTAREAIVRDYGIDTWVGHYASLYQQLVFDQPQNEEDESCAE